MGGGRGGLQAGTWVTQLTFEVKSQALVAAHATVRELIHPEQLYVCVCDIIRTLEVLQMRKLAARLQQSLISFNKRP